MSAEPKGEIKPASRHTINLRTTAEQKSLIDRAAGSLGKSRTEFMLDSAREAAINALLDRTVFVLDEDRFAAFSAALDAPAGRDAKTARLLAAAPPWDE